jgi:CRP-like cAMP-binding protein
METLERVLAEHPLLQGLEPKDLALITGCASNVRFEAGEFIFREGEEAHSFYLLRHGRVALELYAPDRGPIIIETLREGDVLGWSWLFPPHRWHFDARAVQLTRAISLDGECLRRKCEEDYRLGYEFMKRFAHILVERFQATRVRLLDLYGSHE